MNLNINQTSERFSHADGNMKIRYLWKSDEKIVLLPLFFHALKHIYRQILHGEKIVQR